MKNKIVFFSHGIQIEILSVVAKSLKSNHSLEPILWVIGDSDKQLGDSTKCFSKVIDLTNKNSDVCYNGLEDSIIHLRNFENSCGNIFINQDIEMDRSLKNANWPRDRIFIHASKVLKNIEIELQDMGDNLLFCMGETNTLYYRMAYRAIHEPYIYIHMVGHWDNRMYFEYDMYAQWKSCIDIYNNSSNNDYFYNFRDIAERQLNIILDTKKQPRATEQKRETSYHKLALSFKLGNFINILKRDFYKIRKNDIDTDDPKDLSIYKNNIFHSFLRIFIRVFRTIYFNKIATNKLPVNSFSTFYLHVEPEKTVEGLAFEYKDQANICLTIAAALPAGMDLLVKENASMKGRRPSSFYTRLRKAKNIKILHSNINTYEILKASEMLFTLTGSVALESIFVGKPVFVLGEIYHKHFNGVYSVKNVKHLREVIFKALTTPITNAQKYENSINALTAMNLASYEGKLGSQFTMKEMSSKENMQFISEAFKKEFSL